MVAMAVPNEALQTRPVGHFQKTRLCKFNILGVCTKGEQCVFAHGAEELRPLPDLTCTKLCKTLIDTGICADPQCSYAHNKEQLRTTSVFHRTKFCKFAKAGHCSLGTKCNFAHCPDEVREPVGNHLAASSLECNNALLRGVTLRHQGVANHKTNPGSRASPLGLDVLCQPDYNAYLRNVPFLSMTSLQWSYMNSVSHLSVSDDAQSEASSDLVDVQSTCSSGASTTLEDFTVECAKRDFQKNVCSMAPLKLVRSAEGELCTLGDEV